MILWDYSFRPCSCSPLGDAKSRQIRFLSFKCIKPWFKAHIASKNRLCQTASRKRQVPNISMSYLLFLESAFLCNWGFIAARTWKMCSFVSQILNLRLGDATCSEHVLLYSSENYLIPYLAAQATLRCLILHLRWRLRLQMTLIQTTFPVFTTPLAPRLQTHKFSTAKRSLSPSLCPFLHRGVSRLSDQFV